MVEKNLSDLERKINYKFNTHSLLRKALTHRSYSKSHNEKLEFLGDSILNFSISSFIFSEEEDLDETLCAYCERDREHCICYTDTMLILEPKPSEQESGDADVQS